MLDKRRHPRFACDLRAEILLGNGSMSARALDVSRGGLCLESNQAFAVGSELSIRLTLIFRDGAYSEPLALPTRVVWCTRVTDGHQLGCAFKPLTVNQLQYLDMFLRFLRGELLTQSTDDDDELSDPDAAPFSESAKRKR